MGFLSNVISGTVKTVLTPVAIIEDVVNVVSGKEIDATKKHIESTIEDFEDAGDEFADGNF